MNHVKIFSYTFPSDISLICDAVKKTMCYFEETCGFLDSTKFFEIKLILNELVLNAVRHGNREDVNKNVFLVAGPADENTVFIIVGDEGEGYNYCEVLGKTGVGCDCTDILDMEECGRGVMLVKSLCESIKFNNKGNKVVVLKRVD